MKSNMKLIALRLPPKVIKLLRDRARAERRSLSSYIRNLIEDKLFNAS